MFKLLVISLFAAVTLYSAPIHKAAADGNIRAVKFELFDGIDINLQNKHGQTALILAVYNEHLDMVELLLRKGAKTNIEMNNGQTAIFTAAYLGKNKMIVSLLE
ncbi:MAG: ankyrin repeat domain-containing protein, partial [Campylobacterota bacterium]